jgi:CDP-glycerol glycerophosphotransferase (TagB/SpsB family)
LFIFKLHPWTELAVPPQGQFPNLHFAEVTMDMYPYFPYVDLLVTDYSSVYYDFLLLKRGVVLFVFDRERYESENRDLILDFDTYTPGPRVTTFDGLLEVLRSNEVCHGPEHERVRALFWGDYCGHASEALASKLRQLLA